MQPPIPVLFEIEQAIAENPELVERFAHVIGHRAKVLTHHQNAVTHALQGQYADQIFVPVARHYGGHYAVSLSGPATVTSASDAPVLTLQTTGAGLVEVTVTRSP